MLGDRGNSLSRLVQTHYRQLAPEKIPPAGPVKPATGIHATIAQKGRRDMRSAGKHTGQAAAPGARRWRDVVVQSTRDLWASGIVETAAALAFYAVLSLFPLLIVGIIVASYIADPERVSQQAIDVLGAYLPAGKEEIEEIVGGAIEERQRVGIISLGVFIVTGRRILGALTKALNQVSDVQQEDDSFRRRAVVELALTVGLAVVGLLAMASGPLIQASWGAARFLPGPDSMLVRIVNETVQALLLLTIFALVYAFVPRGDRAWRAVLTGASVATVLFLIAQGIFTLLIDEIWPNLSLLYGPLATAALLLLWSWYVALITLVGGGLASHVKVIVLEHTGAQQASDVHRER